MGIRFLTTGVALVMGCYSPSIAPCLYTCDNNNTCPDSLACNADHWCASTKETSCGSGSDAGSDSCTWTDVSNVDVCTNRFDLIAADWNVGAAVTINTDTLTVTDAGGDALSAGAVKMVLDQGGGASPALVIVVHDLSIIAPVTVTGSLPLILVASGKVTLGADVIVTPSSSASPGAITGQNGEGTTGGGGGGGGGYGTSGGAGGPGGVGSTVSGAGGIPGPAATPTAIELVPLRGGAGGGTGGMSTQQPGAAGRGGGAIEITARTTIELTGGSIRANGGGGLAKASPGGTGGGGGGGAGGAIFLEAPMVTLSNTKLCANGGGGGGSQPGSDGMESNCDLPGAGGSDGSGNDGGGLGAVGTLSGTSGQAGKAVMAGVTVGLGGGGGGGGVGLIRIRGVLARTNTPISPPNGT